MSIRNSQQTLLSAALIFISCVFAASNCNPSNCSASCTPSCSANEVCTMSTMTTCGVCPDSKCVSRAALGLPTVDASSGSSSNAGLIGGVVGGLVGGGFVIGVLVFFFVRRRNKKKLALPLAFRNPNLSKGTLEMQENSRQITSGVIPVTFIPPSTHSVRESSEGSEAARSRYNSFATFNNDLEDPFSDRPVSNAPSVMTTNTGYYSRRGSSESQIVGQQKATVIQATQALRARPTIMRVKTVRQADGLTRSGSLKTIKPEKPANVTPSPPEKNSDESENPFDDKNKASPISPSTESIARNNKMDSVMSAPGDGEITIFWNGS
ncbi:uncharacterized protein B0P05DRAFT_551456 [Gilbertella persicaria]|uniref:Membrane anchor Opy2 N-terminal domain-containing protein n=1 Tax=Rhizopus stolonifer TaxID=4846 RepID=A0A367J1I3_RHIST|nr:uncharacterized protein B0P05DRAFT_551456 [Gilbertella persicaria]KAI8069068.1 hypothetical protein B0P05DRAFT_551456 [Gilbertella persicaria]RCH83795.1 hypothetical protein CU098_005785 [Rhizopus stolonifer]